MQPIASQDMTLNQPIRGAARGARAHLIGQRREAQFDALSGIALALAVQRLMLAELFEEDHRQRLRAGEAARRDMERVPAAGVDRFALLDRRSGSRNPSWITFHWTRDDLERLRDILAELREFAEPRARGSSAVQRLRPAPNGLGTACAGRLRSKDWTTVEGYRTLRSQFVLDRVGLNVLQPHRRSRSRLRSERNRQKRRAAAFRSSLNRAINASALDPVA